MQGDFFLTNWFLVLMRWIYGLLGSASASGFGSVALTIVICTLAMRLISVFSDIKTRKSSAKMALIQPEIEKLKRKYANDPQKLNREQSKLMRENGIGMLSSCLPLLITMPLFFCFFAAFRYWSSEMTLRLLVEDNALELFKSFKFLWVNNIWQPDNGFMPVVAEGSTFLRTANLSKLLYLADNPEVWEKLTELGIAAKSVSGGAVGYTILNTNAAIASFDAALEPMRAVYPGVNNGWFLMSIIAAGTNFLSAWLMQKGQPQSAANDQAAKSSKWMTFLFPIMSFIFCLNNNSAFAVYWAFSSILQIIITFILNKLFPKVSTAKEVKK